MSMTAERRIFELGTRKLSYRRLAELCACSRGHVKKVVEGQRDARVEKHIAALLGMEPISVFGAPARQLTESVESKWDHFHETAQ